MTKDVNKETFTESFEEGLSLRKRLAMGKPLPGGSFGVGSTDHVDKQDAVKRSNK